jgi:hypothetical protein
LAELATLPGLANLTLAGESGLSAVGLALVAGLPDLRTLELLQSSVQHDGLAALSPSPSIETLVLGGGGGATDAGLAAVARMPALRALTLEGFGQVTDAGLESLSAPGRLEGLILSELPRVTDAGLLHLPALGRLETLSLYDLPLATGAGVAAAVGRIGSLDGLSLEGLEVDDGFLRAIAGHARLRSLRLGDLPGLTDAGLLAVAQGFPALEELGLGALQVNVTEDGVARFRELRPEVDLVRDGDGEAEEAGEGDDGWGEAG